MGTSEHELLHLTVDVWHPSCWTLETTREADGGLYTHDDGDRWSSDSTPGRASGRDLRAVEAIAPGLDPGVEADNP